MPNQGLQALAKLAHQPSGDFQLETEFGLRINVVRGVFEAHVTDFEEEVLEGVPKSTKTPVKERLYQMGCAIGVDGDQDTNWLTETTNGTRSHPDESDIRNRYANYAKEWTEALSEWVVASKEFGRRDSLWLNEDNKLKTSYVRQNSWLFQGALLACWLAIQNDVVSVAYCLWGEEKCTFTHENTEHDLQAFLKSFPWFKANSRS